MDNEKIIEQMYADAVIPQPIIPADTSFAELPKTLERRCCRGKTCGNTDLVLEAKPVVDAESPTGASLRYGYLRDSNESVYFGWHSTVAELIAEVNDPDYFPVDKAKYDAASEASRTLY